MTMTLRTAQERDATTLLALENRCFDSDQLGLRSFRRLISSSTAQVWCLFEGTELVGYILLLTRKNSGWWRIYSIAVAPEQRGKGYARMLVTHVITQANLAKAEGIRLEVKVTNKSAISLYQALGFEVQDILPGYYADGQDGYRMQRSQSVALD